MDDLLGEDWQRAANKPVSANTTKPSPFAAGFNLTTTSLQPSRSGASTPSSIVRPASTNNGGKPTGNDSFGSLLSLKSQGSGKSLSMQERQQQILEQKRRQQEQDTQLWNNLGSRSATPDQRRPSPSPVAQTTDDTDDILAAFNRSAPVNAATHFPPPVSASTTGKNSPAPFQSASSGTATGQFDDDDDPFGLAQLSKSNNARSAPSAPAISRDIADDDDDDILGDLAKPVSQAAPKRDLSRTPEIPQQANDYAASTAKENPQDKLIAELVDMGFPAGSARIALNESGDNVEAAVSWLLRQAHEESKQKAQAESRRQASPAGVDGRSYRQDGSLNGRSRGDERSSSGTRRPDGQRATAGEKDPGQMAQEFGSKLFKSANSLWKASQKQMAKTMAEFQQERDHSQPKWMQESQAPSGSNGATSRPARDAFLTDEAALLDAPRDAGRGQTQSAPRTNGHESKLPFRDSAEPKSRPPAARPRDSPPVPSNFADKRPAAKLSRQDVEEQSAQAYVSPARRRKATPVNDVPPKAEVDLFSPDPGLVTNSAPAKPPPPKTVRSAQVSPASRAQAIPPRTIPQVSPAVLATSSRHRKAGGEAFKRGDYAAAHDSYGAALAGLPERHPVLIIVLCNRSLTGLKTGDAKTAIADAERALEIIGAGQGVGEKIDAGPGEESKEMRDFYGKALMRKAEALEHVERWTDAASAWRQAVEAGVGGAVSIRGRDRCEKAAAPKPPPPAGPPKPKAAPPARKPPTATRLGNGSAASSRGAGAASGDAVHKLRAANAAAEKADDERFALADQVDARLTAWRGGKADNLRALLQSLDGVLWAEAGWMKVGMSDLVMPNKVKIIYMKAIAKVHPDKIPQDATTEQRMISGAVFSTLNEAWDKFKKDNNL